jgi:cell pole-organizing protein PopZ
MELTEKNGHSSIEEILASVRRIIAEEPGAGAPAIDLGKTSHYPRGDGLLEDPSDFDLPSMFKTPSPAQFSDRPAPLFGRLSDAIRGASGGSSDRGEHALSTLKMQRPETVDAAAASHFLLSTFHEANSPRADEIAEAALAEFPMQTPTAGLQPIVAGPVAASMSGDAAPSAPVPYVAASETSAPVIPQVPRQMAAFKDTRFRGMGSAPVAMPDDVQPFVSPFEAEATEALVSAAASALDSAPLPTVVAHSELPVEDIVAVEAPATLTAAIVASYPSLAAGQPPMESALAPHVPPPVPATPGFEAAPQPAAPIEDSTADLLRPMLRQWLAENMPRMVEKALHIEVAETVKSGKK